MLKKQYSPEQISGVLNKEHGISLSHQAIYDHVGADKSDGGHLWKNLHHSSKKRKKRYGSNDYRGRIKNRVGIEKRPAVVDERSRIGDWEIDTIIGKGHKGTLVTIVERKSRYTLSECVNSKNAREVAEATVELLSPIKDKVLTITADNGREFSLHEEIARRLDTQFYFARPYHSWERGTNENTNSLIRQYFPKSTDLREVTDGQVKFVCDRLNDRPRKTLDFLRPNHAFLKEPITNAG